MMPDFAFIQSSPERIFVGWGPFHEAAERIAAQPAFYITDYFFDNPNPWKHPATWEELPVGEFVSRFPPGRRPSIRWQPVDPREFQSLFDLAHSAIDRGTLKKVVPAVFQRGILDSPEEDLVAWLVASIPSFPPSMVAYGCSLPASRQMGATPELLISADGSTYATVALAGTRSLDRARELLEDPKELREHRIVVDDIVDRLGRYGTVSVGKTDIVSFPALAHLRTPIEIRIDQNRDPFERIVRRLHPTAALGAWPRGEEATRWLRESDRQSPRRGFGAPFGLVRNDGTGLAVVAIRSVDWTDGEVRIGSGGGILAESRFQSEFEELERKRRQVRTLLRLE